jgi:hypothetical protein
MEVRSLSSHVEFAAALGRRRATTTNFTLSITSEPSLTCIESRLIFLNFEANHRIVQVS